MEVESWMGVGCPISPNKARCPMVYIMDQGSKESKDQEGEWGGAVV